MIRLPTKRLQGTKAETLAGLRGRVVTALVPDLLYFPLSDWCSDSSRLLAAIIAKFSGRTLAVRSSARVEDCRESSMAGHFRTCLGVDCAPSSLERAIAEVSAGMCEGRGDQILVQVLVTDVRMSGVVFTRHPGTGAPYFVLEYDDESGTTDRVTNGRKRGKREVFAQASVRRLALPAGVRQVLSLCCELEDLLGSQPLDIEFAITRAGTLVLLQVRPLLACPGETISVSQHSIFLSKLANQIAGLSRPVRGLAGSGTLLGQMPDWNPAELLGPHPRPLAVSLFRLLIADSVWREARARMGYKEVVDEALIRILAGRPFVDVRNSFNSLLPAGLPAQTEDLLADAWMSRLRANPHLHDKVEFEVAQTISDFCFEANHRAWYPGLLTTRAYREYRTKLLDLTRRNVRLNGSLSHALKQVSTLSAGIQKPAIVDGGLSKRVSLLLAKCRDQGTLPFAVIARHAFIAEAFLRSLVGRGVWDDARLSGFRNSVRSVGSEVRKALSEARGGRLSRADFNRCFGHLRPSSFDIRSYRYDCTPELFETDRQRVPEKGAAEGVTPGSVTLCASECKSVNQLLKETSCDLEAEELLEYCRTAIHGREYAKLLFSRNLSDILETIAGWGERRGLSREDLSFLTLEDLLSGGDRRRAQDIVEKRREYEIDETVQLPQLICEPRDVYRIVEGETVPNFVTSRTAQGVPACLGPRGIVSAPALHGKIVLIESADPGFDWIFGERIKGLITKYGGSNSHMAIRCAEMSLPAAIGVGEQLFEALRLSPRIELSCGEGTVRGLYA